MGTLRRSLLLLCMAMTIATFSAQQGKRLRDDDATAILLDRYNQKSDNKHIFKVVEATAYNDMDDSRILRLIIQETKCLKSSNQNPNQCEVKVPPRGKFCRGKIPFYNGSVVFGPLCDLEGLLFNEEVSNAEISPGQGSESSGRGNNRGGRRQRRHEDAETQEVSDAELSPVHGFGGNGHGHGGRGRGRRGRGGRGRGGRRGRPFRPGPGPFPSPQPGPDFPRPQPDPDLP
ncbi:uncharacterized protein LOC141494905 [Macrotis lagotis]|uniref:uncharacterized protein LOC141494905 n=1 Tax=Macrotis lagotis TaxID=92651 RepID=UPI003D688E89